MTRIKIFLALDGYTLGDAIVDAGALVALALTFACFAVVAALIAGA